MSASESSPEEDSEKDDEDEEDDDDEDLFFFVTRVGRLLRLWRLLPGWSGSLRLTFTRRFRRFGTSQGCSQAEDSASMISGGGKALLRHGLWGVEASGIAAGLFPRLLAGALG